MSFNYNSSVCYNVLPPELPDHFDMFPELRTALLIVSFHELSETVSAKSGSLTDLGRGFYVSADGSTCFYMTRFIIQNMLPPTEDFVEFARSCMEAISDGKFKELTD